MIGVIMLELTTGDRRCVKILPEILELAKLKVYMTYGFMDSTLTNSLMRLRPLNIGSSKPKLKNPPDRFMISKKILSFFVEV